MSKPRDPVIAVIAYFESAELPLVRQTLAIVQAIVRKRTPGVKAAAPKPRAVKPATSAAS